jgi:phosphate:Na+ symporter
MLGADVGSAVVAQILAFDIHWLAPVLLLGGVIGFSAGQGTRRDMARVAVGLGLMLLALGIIVGSSQPLRASPTVAFLLGALDGETFLAVLVAALLAWLAHSTLATVLLIASLAAAGALGPALALKLVLGANVGGAIAPVIASLGGPAPGRRVPLGNLIFKTAGVAVALPLVGLVAPLLTDLGGPGRQAAYFHLGFNLAIATIFIWLIDPVGKLVARLLPEPPADETQTQPRHLDPAAIDTPTIAIACAARETLRMADTVETMLKRTLDVLRTDNRRLVGDIERMDDVIDRLHEAIKLYLTEITRGGALSDAESRRWSEIMAFTINLEHVGDIIDKNLMEMAAKRIKNNYHFSDEGLREIADMHGHVLENLQIAMSVFMSGDIAMARRLLERKALFRDLERKMAESHLARLRDRRPETIETSALHLDILRDLKRINSHLTSVAYPILDLAGELADSRLKRAEV